MLRRRGMSSIVLAVMTAVVLFGLGLTMSFLSSYTISGERRFEARIRARYLAEAGLALAYAELRAGRTSVAIDRPLFRGHVRVQSHQGRDIDTGRDCVDLLSQGVVREQAVVLYARVVPGAPLFSTEGGTSRRMFVQQQLAVPKSALGPHEPSNAFAVGPGAHVLVETHFRMLREANRTLYREKLAPLGRRGFYRFCRDGIARIVGSQSP